MAGLDVTTVLAVVTPSVVSGMLIYVETDGHVVPAILEEIKDEQGSSLASGNVTQTYRCSHCVRQGSVEVPI